MNSTTAHVAPDLDVGAGCASRLASAAMRATRISQHDRSAVGLRAKGRAVAGKSLKRFNVGLRDVTRLIVMPMEELPADPGRHAVEEPSGRHGQNGNDEEDHDEQAQHSGHTVVTLFAPVNSCRPHHCLAGGPEERPHGLQRMDQQSDNQRPQNPARHVDVAAEPQVATKGQQHETEERDPRSLVMFGHQLLDLAIHHPAFRKSAPSDSKEKHSISRRGMELPFAG